VSILSKKILRYSCQNNLLLYFMMHNAFTRNSVCGVEACVLRTFSNPHTSTSTDTSKFLKEMGGGLYHDD